MSAPQPEHTWSTSDIVLWPNGVEGRVYGVDWEDNLLMDECGDWFCAEDVDLVVKP